MAKTFKCWGFFWPLILERNVTEVLGIVSVSSRHVRDFTNYTQLQPHFSGKEAISFYKHDCSECLGCCFYTCRHQESQNEVARLKYFPHGCSVSPFRKKIIGYHDNQLLQHSTLSNHTGAALLHILYCSSRKTACFPSLFSVTAAWNVQHNKVKSDNFWKVLYLPNAKKYK